MQRQLRFSPRGGAPALRSSSFVEQNGFPTPRRSAAIRPRRIPARCPYNKSRYTRLDSVIHVRHSRKPAKAEPGLGAGRRSRLPATAMSVVPFYSRGVHTARGHASGRSAAPTPYCSAVNASRNRRPANASPTITTLPGAFPPHNPEISPVYAELIPKEGFAGANPRSGGRGPKDRMPVRFL